MSTTSERKNVGIIILAAGSSSRLGEPKQLLNYNGENLLCHAIKVAVETNAGVIVVVLGANADAIQKKVQLAPAHVVINSNYEQGMSSSIRCGINSLLSKAPEISSVLIMLCDQPYVTTLLLNDLIKAYFETAKPIVACAYANTFGPPALFYKDLFPELLQLEGDTGARKVILNYANDVATIPFEAGEIDIDTQTDYKKLLSNINR
jgi:molybdenum cofactor cytidylyltransferase